MIYEFKPVRARTGSPDEEGRLVRRDERSVAVPVQLPEQHGEVTGKWVVETGFASPETAREQAFESLRDAEAWFDRDIEDSRPFGRLEAGAVSIGSVPSFRRLAGGVRAQGAWMA